MKNVRSTQLVKTMLFSTEEFDEIIDSVFPGQGANANYDMDGLWFNSDYDESWGIEPEELNEKLSRYFGVEVISVHLDSYPNVWVAYKETEQHYNKENVGESGTKAVSDAFMHDCTDESSEYLAGLLMDDSMSTSGVFEDLAGAFLERSEDFKLGMDMCFAYLTGLHMDEFAKSVLERTKENEKDNCSAERDF